MFTKYFSVLAASAAIVSAYTAPTTLCTNSCNPIAKPGLQEAVPAGTTYTVTWNPTTTGTVTILLLRGPADNLVVLSPIGEKLPNSGTYAWSVPSTLETDVTHYGIQLINDADGTYQYSTQFGISGGSGSSSASVSGSMSTSASSASSSLTAAASTSMNITSSSFPTGAAVSSGSAFTNTSIISPSSPMTVPSTLETAAATSAGSGASSTGAGASASASKAASAADSVKMSFGGAVVALMAAVAAL